MKNFLFEKKTLLVGVPLLLLCVIVALVLVIILGGDDGPQPDQITITYAHWNMDHDNALELRMIQAFMDKHPHIYVEIDENIRNPWMQSLAAAASANRLPDVFMIDDLGAKVANGWLMDITSLAVGDIDYFDLPRIVQEAVLVNGAVFALPFAQDIHGYFVNRDLFIAMGMEPPAFGISAEDFFDAVRAATDLSRPSIGLNHTFSFVEWYPGAVRADRGFFAYDGTGFALNSPEMLEAVRVAAELYSMGYSFNSIPTDRVAGYFPIGYDLGAFRIGQMAFFYGGAGLMNMMVNQVYFDWDFIGVPGGRAITTLEVIGISADTNHPEEAYLLARWMGHSTEGNLRRMEYAREMGIITDSLPISTNRQVLENLRQIIPAPGLMGVYNAMDRALIDGHRVLPGYMQARYTAPTGISIAGTQHVNVGVHLLLRYSIIGDVNFADYSAIAESIARQQLEAALAGLR